jgi:hypothetical protein
MDYYIDYYRTIYHEVGRLEVTKNCPKCNGTGKKGKPKKKNFIFPSLIITIFLLIEYVKKLLII